MQLTRAIMLSLCLSASALGADVVGVYDENEVATNTVDFVAGGSSLTNTQFATNVLNAYNNDLGGVIDGSILAGQYEYGVNASKTLQFRAVDGTNWGIGVPGVAISGRGAFASTSDGGYQFTSFGFAGIVNGLPNEQVVEFGVTVLSLNRSYGNVTVEGRLVSGDTLSASRTISEAGTLGDTFYGFTAPAGDYFTGFSLTYDGPVVPDVRLWFDDIGFRTAQVTPPPESLFVKEVVDGPDRNGDRVIDRVVPVRAADTSEFTFRIAFKQPDLASPALVVDEIPGEWELVSCVPEDMSKPDLVMHFPGPGRKKPTRIEWHPTDNDSALLVTVRLRPQNKRSFLPLKCGCLLINEGAAAWDPASGAPLLDGDGNPLVSNRLYVAAMTDENGDGRIDWSGNGDEDGDGLTDYRECELGTDPCDDDTDRDRVPDGADADPLDRSVQ